MSDRIGSVAATAHHEWHSSCHDGFLRNSRGFYRRVPARPSGFNLLGRGFAPAFQMRVSKMPSWTEKDARQYDHIKESSLERGRSEEDAEEIAARTVNKQRRLHEQTPSKTTAGTGNPNRSLESRKIQELRNRAAELHIAGRSKMRKQALIEAIRGRS